MILKLKRTPGIYLVGFMGCGKSTVGRLLSKEVGWPFLDLDHEIEAEQKRSITDIFDREGETAFRAIETEALRARVRRVQFGRPLVMSLGGGAFTQPVNVELIRDNGVSVWVDCPLEIIRHRLSHSHHRPLARDPAQVERLYYERRAAYAQADYRVEVLEDNSQRVMERMLHLPFFAP